jgi:hypothetical protein
MLHGVQEDVEHTREGGFLLEQVAGHDDRGPHGRRMAQGTMRAAGTAVLDQDGRQHAKAITDGVQVAHPVNPGMFEAGDFGDGQSFLRYPHMDQRLDLETIAPQPPVALAWQRRGGVEVQHRDVLLPEHVVPVAEVRVPGSVAEVDHPGEQAVAQPAQPRDVTAAPAWGEPCPLGEVRAAHQRLDEFRDLGRIRRAVRVDHGDDVTGGGFEPAGQRVALSSASLLHDDDVRPQLAGHRYRIVHRVPVDHDHLVEVLRQPGENVRQISSFVQCRNDHGYAWIDELRAGLRHHGSPHDFRRKKWRPVT